MGVFGRLSRCVAPLNTIIAEYDVRGDELREGFDDLHNDRVKNMHAWNKYGRAGFAAAFVLLPEASVPILAVCWVAGGVGTVRTLMAEHKPIDRNRAVVNRAIRNRSRALG